LHNEACLHWIAQQALGFLEVRVKIRATLPAQLLPHLATALNAAAALAPSGQQLQLDAGEQTRARKLRLIKSMIQQISAANLSSVPMTHTVPCSADFDITDPQFGCQQLAGVLTHWEADIAYVQQLSCLTQLTHLSWNAECELSSVEELQQLSLLQTFELPRLSAVPRDVHNFKFVQSLSLHGIEEQVCSIESLPIC